MQNDEQTADLMLRLVKNGQKLVNSLSAERKSNIHRLSGEYNDESSIFTDSSHLFSLVCYKNHTLVASVWNHRVHVVKRLNPET